MVISKKKGLVATLVASVLLSSAPAFAENKFLVAPGRIEADLNAPTTRTVIVSNVGSDTIRLELFPEFVRIGDEKGEIKAGISHLKDQAGTESLEDFVTVSPKVLTLKPGQRRDVKVNINGKRSRTNKNAKPLTKDGDYRTHLIVRMKETALTQQVQDPNNTGLSMNLDIKFETAIAIYGRIGSPDYKDVNLTCDNGSVTLENNTNYKINGKLRAGESESPFVVMRNSTSKADISGTVDLLIDDEKFKSIKCK